MRNFKNLSRNSDLFGNVKIPCIGITIALGLLGTLACYGQWSCVWELRLDPTICPFYEVTAATSDHNGIYLTGRSKLDATNKWDYLTLCVSTYGQLAWKARYDGPDQGDDEAQAVTVDSRQNVIVTGSTSGTMKDITTIKYDRNGVQQSVARIDGDGHGDDVGNAIVVDPRDNIFITGTSYVKTTGSPRGDYVYNEYLTAGYLAAVDAGTWTRHWAQTAFIQNPQTIAVDTFGKVWVSGLSVYDANPMVSSAGFATLRYDAYGQQEALMRYDSFGNCRGLGKVIMAAAPNGGMVVAGTMDDTYPEPPGISVIQYDANCKQRWVQNLTFAHPTYPTDLKSRIQTMVVNANGDIYITGRAERELLSGNYDIYTAKLSSLGDLVWQRFYNGPANGHDVPCGLTLGDQGHLYVAGTSQDTNGVNEPVILMYSPQGELVAEKRCGNSNGTVPQECTAMVSGFNNSIILVTSIPTATPGQRQMILTKYTPAYAFIDRVYSQKPSVTGTGPANLTYRIQKMNNFQSWEDVDTVSANSVGWFSWEMPIPQGSGRGFYRWITP